MHQRDIICLYECNRSFDQELVLYVYKTLHAGFFGACLKLVWRFEGRTFYQLIGDQTHISTSWHAKLSLALDELR
jgi:hypothetical protein